jgi:hypothetical protein
MASSYRHSSSRSPELPHAGCGSTRESRELGDGGDTECKKWSYGEKVMMGRNGRLKSSIKPTISVDRPTRPRDVDIHLTRVIRSKWGSRYGLREKFRSRLSRAGYPEQVVSYASWRVVINTSQETWNSGGRIVLAIFLNLLRSYNISRELSWETTWP